MAGELGGRRLVSPDGTSTRPTTDRVREAIFNSLGSAGLIDGALVADLFAGSGALGIEALSRGAEHCMFVERDRAALRALRGEPRRARPAVDGARSSRSTCSRSPARSTSTSCSPTRRTSSTSGRRCSSSSTVDVLVAESGRAIEPAEGWEQRRTQAVRPRRRSRILERRRHRPRTRFRTR